MSRRLASFLVPVLTVIALLYRGLDAVDVNIADTATIVLIAAALLLAAALGLAAARGGTVVRILVFGITTGLIIDMTVHPARFFTALEERAAARRDARRIEDLHRIQEALDGYARTVGRLPEPVRYGEATGPPTFWQGWWDVSSADGDKDGNPFLDFLEEHGIPVPLDPVNSSPDTSDPRVGRQYVYFVVPAANEYQGGTCSAWTGKGVYVLAITDLETEVARPPQRAAGSGCPCVWRDAPDFFQQHFDYVLCGAFE